MAGASELGAREDHLAHQVGLTPAPPISPAWHGPGEKVAPNPSFGSPLEETMAAPSSVLAWRIPCTEEPGGLQSIGSQRVGTG